jgi:hypothetical protein
MKNIRHTLLVLLSGFIGGLVGSAVLNPQALEAAVSRGQFYDLSMYNKNGKMVGFMGPGDAGQGSIFLFDSNGGAGGEKGQALVGMSDRSDQLRFLFRLHGSKDSPTLIMKDQSGRDRIVMGLDGETQAPYFFVLDDSGAARDILK